jgi:CBS domain-containing protein
MSDEPFVVAPDSLLEEVAEAMAKNKHGSALVVERATLVGIFTSTDALRALVILLRRGMADPKDE